jgi:large subunit ribosomal protein L22
MAKVLEQTKTQKAILRYAKITPRKARLVANLIKGMPIDEAKAQLMHNPKRASKIILKLLKSAEANASVKKLDLNKLYVKNIVVNMGPKLERYLPRARGMATPIQKKMSHIEIVLAEKETIKPKFNIVEKKKQKKEKEEIKPKEKKEKQVKKDIEVEEKQKSKPKEGFLKRIFRRKSI